MWEICITIHGRLHCFPIPVLIHIPHPPPPNNYPELELAISVLQLAQMIQHAVPESQLTKQLTDVATHFVQQVQKALPHGVELKQMQAQ
jgi:hypothetical protein